MTTRTFIVDCALKPPDFPRSAWENYTEKKGNGNTSRLNIKKTFCAKRSLNFGYYSNTSFPHNRRASVSLCAPMFEGVTRFLARSYASRKSPCWKMGKLLAHKGNIFLFRYANFPTCKENFGQIVFVEPLNFCASRTARYGPYAFASMGVFMEKIYMYRVLFDCGLYPYDFVFLIVLFRDIGLDKLCVRDNTIGFFFDSFLFDLSEIIYF